MCDGGHFEGFAPVIQVYNASPHHDTNFYKYVVNFYKAKKWIWEPQGAHMPHMNVLYFSLFPTISRHHSHLIRSLRGTRVAKEVEIWKIAAKVWEELLS